MKATALISLYVKMYVVRVRSGEIPMIVNDVMIT